MRFPPLEVIASWPKPNSVNPVNRGPALMIIELILLPFALLCLGLRLFVRIHILHRSWWDDWLMVGAAICGCGVTICVVLATQLYGWNIHVWDLTIHQMIQGRKISIAGQTIFLFASGLAKTSILASYLRIAPKRSRFWYLTWATIALVVAAIFVFLIVLWTQCIPSSSYWNLFAPARDCEAEGPPLMGQTITTVITDFFVYILPMPTLYSLRMSFTQRLGLMVLFGLGGLVVIAGCMRTYWIHHVVYETYDVTWEGFFLWIWTAVEVNLGVICGCIPALKPLLFPSRPHGATGYGGSATMGSERQKKSRITDIQAEGEELDNFATESYKTDLSSTFNKTEPLPKLRADSVEPPQSPSAESIWGYEHYIDASGKPIQ